MSREATRHTGFRVLGKRCMGENRSSRLRVSVSVCSNTRSPVMSTDYHLLYTYIKADNIPRALGSTELKRNREWAVGLFCPASAHGGAHVRALRQRTTHARTCHVMVAAVSGFSAESC
jgi:hypothetical protein